ncbi:MAG: hypothetical protein QOG23_5017, partial [Blastocatellia bacterium]|nr:hypothetical protein [Blastocatellia bacterium]
MNDSSGRAVGPPIDDRSRVPARVSEQETGALLLSTPRERAAYAAGRRVRLLYLSLLV